MERYLTSVSRSTARRNSMDRQTHYLALKPVLFLSTPAATLTVPSHMQQNSKPPLPNLTTKNQTPVPKEISRKSSIVAPVTPPTPVVVEPTPTPQRRASLSKPRSKSVCFNEIQVEHQPFKSVTPPRPSSSFGLKPETSPQHSMFERSPLLWKSKPMSALPRPTQIVLPQTPIDLRRMSKTPSVYDIRKASIVSDVTPKPTTPQTPTMSSTPRVRLGKPTTQQQAQFQKFLKSIKQPRRLSIKEIKFLNVNETFVKQAEKLLFFPQRLAFLPKAITAPKRKFAFHVH